MTKHDRDSTNDTRDRTKYTKDTMERRRDTTQQANGVRRYIFRILEENCGKASNEIVFHI